MHDAHNALPGLQVIVLMLCRIDFHLSGKVDALHLDNGTAKSYLCNKCGTVSLFLSGVDGYILNLTDKHNINLISAYIHTHLNEKASYLLQGSLVQEWHVLPHIV